MVLRLVLVSVVAGLGMSPPAEHEVAGWSRTVQTWLDARIAQWNGTQPRHEDDPVGSSEPELAADCDVAAALERALMAVFGELPETALAVPAPVAVAPGEDDRDFEAVVEEMVADFSEDDTEAGAREVQAPAVVAVEMDEEVEVEVEDLEAEIAAAELEAGAASRNLLAPSMATLPTGEDESFTIADDFELGPGAELTLQASEPTAPAWLEDEVPAGCPAAVPTPTASNPLRNAVRLTRDALYAWINLLESPALVTVPQ
jgi:hypothetical protein